MKYTFEIKRIIYKTAISLTMHYYAEYWVVKKHVSKIHVVELRMLIWMCGKTRRDKIKNELICKMIEVATIEQKIDYNGLIIYKTDKCPGYSIDIKDNARGQGRLKLTYVEIITMACHVAV